MIGIKIRGIRHLWRMSDTLIQKILVKCGDHGYDICEVLKSAPNSKIGEHMFIFNPCYNQLKHSMSSLRELSEKVDKIVANTGHCRVLEIDKSDEEFRKYDRLLNEIILLPNSFDKDYEKFLTENSKMVNVLEKKYGINLSNDNRSKRIYIYTDGSKNFFEWAMNLYFKAGCSMRTIINILTWNEYYKQLTKNLSKGTITAYTNQDSINSLIEELENLRNEKRINDSINSFNTAQKKLLKTNELSKNDKNALARFSKLSEVKRNNFIRKVSTIDDYKELMRQLKHVTSVHFEWSKNSFMDFLHNVEGINYEIVYENNFVVLVKVTDYETIKQLGKTTNWCISKNKLYWNNYMERNHGKATQYMIFDFSKLEDDNLSIVGFTTTRNRGITSAHNFVNDNLINNDVNISTLMLKSYIARFDGSNSIYKILQKCGIDINLVIHYDKPQYQWNYEGLMSYLYECVDKNNVDVIKHEGEKLVLSVHDENIRYFFGDPYITNVSSEDYEEQHIIFADFSMSQYDPNKLVFGIIYTGEAEEDYCNCMYNEASMALNNSTFDVKLIEFGLPYDIIRRTDDIKKIIKNAFSSFNTKVIKDCLKKDKYCLHHAMMDYLGYDAIYSTIYKSLIEYLSFDYLDMIYDNGHRLSDYMDGGSIAEILKCAFNNLKIVGRQLFPTLVLEKPNEETIEAFLKEKLNNRNDVLYVGNYLIIKKILMNEKGGGINPNKIYYKIINSINNTSLTGSLLKELMFLMLGNLDMSVKRDTSNLLVSYFLKSNDEEMQDTIKNLADKYNWIAQISNKEENVFNERMEEQLARAMPHFQF